MNARNRVWLARRCLRWPFSWACVGTWTVVQLVRERDPHALRTWLTRVAGRLKSSPWGTGPRPSKLHWRTIWTMTREGSPARRLAGIE